MAIGIFIEPCHASSVAASAELDPLAERANSTIHAAAQLLIASILIIAANPGATDT